MSKPIVPYYMQDIDENMDPSSFQGQDTSKSPSSMSLVDPESIHDDTTIDYSQYEAIGNGLSSKAHVTRDGRINVSINLDKDLPEIPKDYASNVNEFAIDLERWKDVPAMSIVIMIVGSRGDVQPYVALGRRLLRDGHRIRIATHGTFESFIRESGLEFFNIGGDPKELMSYMVKNPGLVPGFESLVNGDIKKKRKMLTEMMEGCWNACYISDKETGRPFTADAIISNPPSFAHIHCAEALGIPLLLSFTMPWSPTMQFPHPLVNIKTSDAEPGPTNYLSYALAELLTWQGIGDIVNRFREKTLGLNPVSIRSGAGAVERLKIPWTYCMSSALVPKPDDWKNHIDISGFYFLDLASSYTPPDDLVKFLNAGPPPIYIGFGSVVVEDAAEMTRTIFTATRQANTRALVSAGWGGLGGVDIPDHIFILGNIPHDWLFERVSAVVHHGGAGTTAIGLKKGRPTAVVPFFGDQPFWGRMISKAGAGPDPIPQKELNIENLTAAINFILKEDAQRAAQNMARQIENEDGLTKGAESFYRHLPLLNMRCDLDPQRIAVWWSNEHCLRLSAFAAQVLVEARQLNIKSLELHRPRNYDTQKNMKGMIHDYLDAVTGLVREPYEGAKKHGLGGAMKGVARGFANLAVRPTPGRGFVVHPLRDALKALRSGNATQEDRPQFATRVAESREAIRDSTPEQREAILRKFQEVKHKTKERRGYYQRLADKVTSNHEDLSTGL